MLSISFFYFHFFISFCLILADCGKDVKAKFKAITKKPQNLWSFLKRERLPISFPAPHLSGSAILTDRFSGRFFPAIFSPRKTCGSVICKILHPCPPFNSGLFLIPPIRSGETIRSFHFRAANFPMSARHIVSDLGFFLQKRYAPFHPIGNFRLAS